MCGCKVRVVSHEPSVELCLLLLSLSILLSYDNKNCPYTTIDEALSGSIVDIEAYLVKLKHDLHIGKEGYPNQVTIAGDQQTNALMKDLQRQHPLHYSWFVVLHGDWHLLKLTSEIIKTLFGRVA